MTAIGTAKIYLFPSDAGGLQAALPSGTRSLLIAFDDAIDGETMGAVIDVLDDGNLAPASSRTARLSFWSDVARIYGSEGASFSIWYGRKVGQGKILDQVK
ncbi:MAG: hypothetical protein M3N98_09620 [Actinomycetota bacterium]|nr:hypothetical protein [Actinomycetota bacterium]